MLDTGPLVAYLYPRDVYHDWAVEQFSSFDPPFLTCEPVITEACFLLARNGLAASHVLEPIESGAIEVAFSLAEHVAALRRAIERYANVPMSLGMCVLCGWPRSRGCRSAPSILISRSIARMAVCR